MANEASPFSGSADSAEDTIYLRRLRLSAVVGYDAWGRPGKAQPVVICIQLNLDTSKTSNSDDLQFSFSYGQMCKEVTSAVDGKSFQDVASLVYELREAARVWPGKTIQCQISLPKTLLRVDGGLTGDFVLVRSSDFWDVSSRRYVIKGAKAACIIGVNAHERLEKQTVNVDLIISGEGTQYSRNRFIPFSDNQNPQDLVKSVLEVGALHFDPERSC